MGNNTHKLIKVPTTCTIWKYLSNIWQVLTRSLRPQQWIFSQYVYNDSNDEMEILFQFLRYCGLQYNRNNASMFDSKHGVKTYMKKLKGILVWSLWILEHVGIVFSNACSSFLMALQDIRIPT